VLTIETACVNSGDDWSYGQGIFVIPPKTRQFFDEKVDQTDAAIPHCLKKIGLGVGHFLPT
jgi:hypothetical protein